MNETGNMHEGYEGGPYTIDENGRKVPLPGQWTSVRVRKMRAKRQLDVGPEIARRISERAMTQRTREQRLRRFAIFCFPLQVLAVLWCAYDFGQSGSWWALLAGSLALVGSMLTAAVLR